jgi:hypothetical protein
MENNDQVNQGFEKMLSDMEVKAKKKIENHEDDGHTLLLADIKALQLNAEDGEYHDFINKKFAAPKISLVEHLRDMMDKAMNGAYDN